MIVLSIHMNNFFVYSIIHVFYIWSSICREDLVFFCRILLILYLGSSICMYILAYCLWYTIYIIHRKWYMYVRISFHTLYYVIISMFYYELFCCILKIKFKYIRTYILCTHVRTFLVCPTGEFVYI